MYDCLYMRFRGQKIKAKRAYEPSYAHFGIWGCQKRLMGVETGQKRGSKCVAEGSNHVGEGRGVQWWLWQWWGWAL